jgi:hypothetical protein
VKRRRFDFSTGVLVHLKERKDPFLTNGQPILDCPTRPPPYSSQWPLVLDLFEDKEEDEDEDELGARWEAYLLG